MTSAEAEAEEEEEAAPRFLYARCSRGARIITAPLGENMELK